MAAAYRQAGVRDKAYDYLSEGLRHDPTDAALHDALARAWRDWGFPDRGLTAAHRAVYYAPRSAEARNTLGTVLWALGQRAEARRRSKQAVGARPARLVRLAQLCRGGADRRPDQGRHHALPAGRRRCARRAAETDDESRAASAVAAA